MPMFQFIDRDPLDLARFEAEVKSKLQANELMGRQNLASMELNAKQSSPEAMLAAAKLQSWQGMSPEEQEETMGIKGPMERELQKAQLEYAKQRPELEQREMKVREDQVKRMADQFSQQYDLSQKEFQLRGDAFQQRIDENAKDNYNKQFDTFIKLLSGLGNDKVKVGQAMEQFMAQNAGIIQDPRITAETAIALGTSLIYGLIGEAKNKGVAPEQIKSIRAQAVMIQDIMRKRAGESQAATSMFTTQKSLIDLAMAEPEQKSWFGDIMGWALPSAAGLGAWYGGKALYKRAKGGKGVGLQDLSKKAGSIFKGGKGGGAGAAAGALIGVLPEIDPFGLKQRYPIELLDPNNPFNTGGEF